MEDDKFKKLIQHIDLDEPDDSFTDNIMKMVETEEELQLSPVLLSLLKSGLLAEPSVEFADNLMANIQPAAAKISEPVITKKIGFIISGAGMVVLLLALATSRIHLKEVAGVSYFSGLSINLPGTANGIMKTASSFLPYLIPVSVLLFADYLFRTRQQQLTPTAQDH